MKYNSAALTKLGYFFQLVIAEIVGGKLVASPPFLSKISQDCSTHIPLEGRDADSVQRVENAAIRHSPQHILKSSIRHYTP